MTREHKITSLPHLSPLGQVVAVVDGGPLPALHQAGEAVPLLAHVGQVVDEVLGVEPVAGHQVGAQAVVLQGHLHREPTVIPARVEGKVENTPVHQDGNCSPGDRPAALLHLGQQCQARGQGQVKLIFSQAGGVRGEKW